MTQCWSTSFGRYLALLHCPLHRLPSLRTNYNLELTILGPMLINDYSKEPWRMIERILQEGVTVTLQTAVPIELSPSVVDGNWYERVEMQLIEQYQKQPQRYQKYQCLQRPNQWCSEEGRRFSMELSSEVEPCMICLDELPNTTVFPCQHRIVCERCIIKCMEKGSCSSCIKCRSLVTHYSIE